MRVLILGGDGYLGWPTAMRLASRGDEVVAVDNYLRRSLVEQVGARTLLSLPELNERAAIFGAATGQAIRVAHGDCTSREFLDRIVAEFQPDALVHYAEQPSAPYSMLGYDEAKLTLDNNLSTTFNVIWSVLQHAPNCHIVKLGTMGEYGTPDIDIEEGWIDIEHKGRSDRFLFPRQGGSLYHTTKIHDTDLLWFYVRTAGLRVTDLMQGPVYGVSTTESAVDERLAPHFSYDDIFGTVINRFLVQAVAGVPLTVYGSGTQTRGFLNIEDTLQCVELALRTPSQRGQLRILNQFTECFSICELAERVARVGNRLGLRVHVQSVKNPRGEREQHHYNPSNQSLLDLGLTPRLLSDDGLAEMLESVAMHREQIDVQQIMPRFNWRRDA